MSGWRRFEHSSTDGEGRFWAIRTVGSTCELRYGAIDDAAVTEERLEHASESEAVLVARQKIRVKRSAGWLEVDVADPRGAPALDSAKTIEQAIAEDPSNLDHWAVYADFLQEVAPVVGERVALGLALARAGSGRARLEARIGELERTHARELFGASLAQLLSIDKYAARIELERRLGMIVGVRLHNIDNGIPKLDSLLAGLLELPLARLLLRLEITTTLRHHSYPKVAAALVARRHPHLRSLFLGDQQLYAAGTLSSIPSLAAVLDAAPMLERLELHGPFHGEASHDRLRALKLRRPSRDVAIPLARWRLPALETLHVYDPGAADWSAAALPQLRHLVIDWPDHGPRLLQALAQAPLLAQLENLTINRSELDARGVELLITNAERFAGPRFIHLFDVQLSVEQMRELHATLPNVRVYTLPRLLEDEGYDLSVGELVRRELLRF